MDHMQPSTSNNITNIVRVSMDPEVMQAALVEVRKRHQFNTARIRKFIRASPIDDAKDPYFQYWELDDDTSDFERQDRQNMRSIQSEMYKTLRLCEQGEIVAISLCRADSILGSDFAPLGKNPLCVMVAIPTAWAMNLKALKKDDVIDGLDLFGYDGIVGTAASASSEAAKREILRCIRGAPVQPGQVNPDMGGVAVIHLPPGSLCVYLPALRTKVEEDAIRLGTRDDLQKVLIRPQVYRVVTPYNNAVLDTNDPIAPGYNVIHLVVDKDAQEITHRVSEDIEPPVAKKAK